MRVRPTALVASCTMAKPVGTGSTSLVAPGPPAPPPRRAAPDAAPRSATGPISPPRAADGSMDCGPRQLLEGRASQHAIAERARGFNSAGDDDPERDVGGRGGRAGRLTRGDDRVGGRRAGEREHEGGRDAGCRGFAGHSAGIIAFRSPGSRLVAWGSGLVTRSSRLVIRGSEVGSQILLSLRCSCRCASSAASAASAER